MNPPRNAPLSVLRGSPTPEELAALLVVLAAVCRAPGEPGPPPAAGRGWGRPAVWHHPERTTAPATAGWRRTPALSYRRDSR